MEIVLASSNEHKVSEINEIVKNSGIKFILPPSSFNPIENGTTFKENSFIKAIEAWKLTKKWTLADDSGLCIDYLDGKPGIYSARYAETAQKRIDRVLSELNGIKNRNARFVCYMTLISPNGELAFSCEGICEGAIAEIQSGRNGFGYDPIFLIQNSDKTMAELGETEKNRISHRGKALKQVMEYIKKIK